MYIRMYGYIARLQMFFSLQTNMSRIYTAQVWDNRTLVGNMGWETNVSIAKFPRNYDITGTNALVYLARSWRDSVPIPSLGI